MEFDININVLFRDVITKVDSRLQVCRNASARFPDARLQLFDIINRMGEASARAQGLAGAITTGRKLEMSEHHLYIMKDSEGSSGHGAIVGILKVGWKRLFVYDRHGQQWEMNPLCVLDFYVHESRQRMGCGRRLFDFMLKSENVFPQHLAIDRPSHKFSSFLAKHYSLKDEIPQVNNFVIFDGFFTKRPDGDFIHNRRNTNGVQPADYPNGISDRINTQQSTRDHSNYSNRMYNYQRANTGLPGNSDHSGSGQRGSNTAAGLPSVLPRHKQQNPEPDMMLRDLNLNPRSAHNMNSTRKMSPKGRLSDAELRSLSAGSSTSRASGLQLQSTLYSRHEGIPAIQSNPPRPQYSMASRPPSGNRNTAIKREQSPPMLQRDGPPIDYKESFNMHQNYQGRAGHLVVHSDPRAGLTQPSTTGSTTTTTTHTNTTTGLPSLGEASKQQLDSVRSGYSYRNGYYTQPALHTNADTSWTVFGVLRNQHQLSARQYGSSRLW